jgi:Protein of unknown function (DUF1236)
MEKPMKSRGTVSVTLPMALLGSCIAAAAMAQTNNLGNPGTGANPAGDTAVSGAIEQKPLLTPAQQRSIYAEVSKDKSKTSPKDFSPVIGADVPPMIELYTLPDGALASVPGAKIYKYTMLEKKVVIVDPTRMRVIDVIDPAPQP